MNKRQELLSFAEQYLCCTASRGDAWVDQELADCKFRDVRLGKRFRKLLQQFSDGIGGSIPWVCQDWANTKAAYRFFSNGKVSEEAILAGHFQSTRERFVANDGPVLILHDTTEFIYRRDDVTAVGVLDDSTTGRDNLGRVRHYTPAGSLYTKFLIVATKSVARRPLSRQASHPASITRGNIINGSCWLITTSFAFGNSCRKRWATSNPLRPGMLISRRITSGRSSRAI